MAILANVRIRLEGPPQWAPTLDSIAEQLELIGAREAANFFPPDCEIDLVVEEGSIKVKLAILGAIYAAIAQYPDFRAGLGQIIQDAHTLSARIERVLESRGAAVTDVQVKPAFPDKLNAVLIAIDRAQESSADDHELQRARAQLEKLMTSVRDERERSFLIKQMPDLPAPDGSPRAASEEHPAIVDDRRRNRRQKSTGIAKSPAPRRPRRRVHRRRRLGLQPS